MNKIIKKIFIFILLILFLTAFSSSYKSFSIDNIAIVVALAIDSAENNKLKVTFQFTNSSSVSESGTTEQAPSTVFTLEASSISTAINLMNSHVGKELNLSHCKLIVFSEEIARKGISEEIYTLINDAQIRPSTNIVISKCSAKYYIQNSKPLFENLLTKYYEVFAKSSQFTGYSSNATIEDFFYGINCDDCQPYAILGGISTEKVKSSSNINSQKSSTEKSNESSFEGESNAENIGLAVFKNDTLVGELNAIENMCFLILKNDIDSFLISVPNPEQENSYLDVYITSINKPKIDVKIVNGSPYITINCKFTGRIYSMQQDSKYLEPEVLSRISQSCNSYLQDIMSNYLYKTSKEFKSDINAFSNLAKSKFLKIKDFENYSWATKYVDSNFKVTVDTDIKSSFLLSET